MPPAPTPEEGIPSGDTPRYTNVAQLLRSLEELRDSLSLRVTQLGQAVERLRIQAAELDRAVHLSPGPTVHGPPETSEGIATASSRPTPVATVSAASNSSPSGPGDSHTMPDLNSSNQPSASSRPTRRPYTSTSAIASEISTLSRPITSAEIHRLLDRASASLSAFNPDDADLSLRREDLEGPLNGLREIRESLQGGITELAAVGEAHAGVARRLRDRSRQERGRAEYSARANREEGSEEATRRVRAREEAQPEESTQHEVQRRLTAMRMERDNRNLHSAAMIRNRSPAPMMMRGSGSGTSTPRPRDKEWPAREARKGLQPTNASASGRVVRAPQVVRSATLPPVTTPQTLSSSASPRPTTIPGLTPNIAQAGYVGFSTSRPSHAAPSSAPPRPILVFRSRPDLMADIHSQINALDLRLDPPDYLSRLTQIIRRGVSSAHTGTATSSTSRAAQSGSTAPPLTRGVGIMRHIERASRARRTGPEYGDGENGGLPQELLAGVSTQSDGTDVDDEEDDDEEDEEDDDDDDVSETASAVTTVVLDAPAAIASDALIVETLARQRPPPAESRDSTIGIGEAGSQRRVSLAAIRARERQDLDHRLTYRGMDVHGRINAAPGPLIDAAPVRTVAAGIPAPVRSSGVTPPVTRVPGRTPHEINAQAELDLAREIRVRAYERYHSIRSARIVATTARTDTSANPSTTVSPDPPQTESAHVDDATSNSTSAVITVRTVETEDLPSDGAGELENTARRYLMEAQMRELRAQQRLSWTRNRLRREGSPGVASPRGSATRVSPRDADPQSSSSSRDVQADADEARRRISEADEQIDLLRAEILQSSSPIVRDSAGREFDRDSFRRWATDVLRSGDQDEVPAPPRPLTVPAPATGPSRGASASLGPRNESPEEVDTLVRIRQLQTERATAAARIEARRQQLAAIRQDLAESRRRVRDSVSEAPVALGTAEIAAPQLVQNVGQGRGLQIDVYPPEGLVDLQDNHDRDDHIRRLLDDAHQVVAARRELIAAIESHPNYDADFGGVTPSSPITASHGHDYSDIRITVEPQPDSDSGSVQERDRVEGQSAAAVSAAGRSGASASEASRRRMALVRSILRSTTSTSVSASPEVVDPAGTGEAPLVDTALSDTTAIPYETTRGVDDGSNPAGVLEAGGEGARASPAAGRGRSPAPVEPADTRAAFLPELATAPASPDPGSTVEPHLWPLHEKKKVKKWRYVSLLDL